MSINTHHSQLQNSMDKEVEKAPDQGSNASDLTLERPLTHPSAPTPSIHEPAPDGGLRAWLQVVCSFFLFFNSWGIVNSFGVFQTYYTTSLLSNESASSISWIGSIQAFLLLAIGVVTGPLFDAGYFYHLIWGGSALTTLGVMMTSLSTKYWQVMLAQGICLGLGSGALFMPSIAIIPLYFTKRRALAMGIAASGSSLGGIIYPIVFFQLQPRIGFPWATRVLGFIVLATQGIVLALMRTRAKPGPMRKLFDISAFKEPPFAIFTAAMFFAFVGTYIPFFYASDYTLHVKGATPALSFYMLSIMNAGSVFGRIIPNLVADKTGPLNIVTPCAMLAGVMAFIWIGVHSVGGMVAFSALYGFFSGCIVSIPPTVIAMLSPRLEIIGTRMGTVFSVASLGLLVGTPVGGAILGDTGHYVGIQAFGANAVMIASVLYATTRVLARGSKLRVQA